MFSPQKKKQGFFFNHQHLHDFLLFFLSFQRSKALFLHHLVETKELHHSPCFPPFLSCQPVMPARFFFFTFFSFIFLESCPKQQKLKYKNKIPGKNIDVGDYSIPSFFSNGNMKWRHQNPTKDVGFSWENCWVFPSFFLWQNVFFRIFRKNVEFSFLKGFTFFFLIFFLCFFFF